MKRLLGISTLALAALLATGATARAETYFGFQIGVTNASPHRFSYREQPRLFYEPSSRVYVVEDRYDDWDMFRYGSSWYACDGDYWYRANSYRGPFYVVDVRAVPRPIFYVPQNHWHRYPRPLASWHRGSGYRTNTARDVWNGRYSQRRVYDRDDRYYNTRYDNDRDRDGRDDRYRRDDRDWRTNDRGNRPPGWDKGKKKGWDKGGHRGHGHDRD